MKLKLLITLAMGAMLTLASSCSDGPDTPPSQRTVLVYMVANNSLSPDSYTDLAEMKQGSSDIRNGRLIVYHHPADAPPRLLEITSDGRDTLLRAYDTAESSVEISQMRRVLSDMRQLAPADTYGLVLWSHATGWLNDKGVVTETEANRIAPLSFGSDGIRNPKKMSITSLARALDGNYFDFIYFDCCHMATVEVAYELRHLTPQIAASPTELELNGMPYDKNLKCFFAPTVQLEAAVRNTFNSYTAPGYFGCCISVIHTSALDHLALVSHKVLAEPEVPGYLPVPYFRTVVMPAGIYDMYHYYDARSASNPSLNNEWRQAFANVITTTFTTPNVFGLDATNFNGLGCHVPSVRYPVTYSDYNTTAWYKDVLFAN